MKSKILLPLLAVVLVLAVAGRVSAQSNERIDELLRQSPATNGHGAYLILTAAGIIGEDTSAGAAFDRARQDGLFPPDASAAGDLTFGRFSYLMMESFGIPGGVLYRLIPGPRYAAREVVYQRWSRTRRTPGQTIDGETATRIVSVYINSLPQGGSR